MFRRGEEYPRDQLLGFIGSKQAQSGIIWGNKEPNCVILTSGGRHSKRAGYEDKRYPDGSWSYFGQGEKNDHDPDRFANKLLIEGIKSVLLFTTREPTSIEVEKRGDYTKRYRFEGIFGVMKWEWKIPETGVRAGDKLLLFHLIPQAESFNEILSSNNDNDLNEYNRKWEKQAFMELRDHLIARTGRPQMGISLTSEYKRAAEQIRIYTKLRANNYCEYCGKKAPFIDLIGFPFLEIHHLLRLADDGPDIPENVAALCPNCHREAHYGSNRENIQNGLKKLIIEKENELNRTGEI